MSRNPLLLFPAHVPIGKANGAPVYLTPEFSRALSELLARVGGPLGVGTEDLAIEAASGGTAPLVGALQQTVRELQEQLAMLAAPLAMLAELRKAVGTEAPNAPALLSELLKRVASLELAGVGAPSPTDWEHPGKLGASTANSGKFTTLEATAKVKLDPLDADVEIKPRGTALVTIQPENPGQVDNMELGKSSPRPARVATLNKITFTQPATGATFTLSGGKTLVIANTLTLSGNDGAALNIGAGGTLGSAAYADSTAYASRSGTPLAAPASDAATTQALANSLRAVLLSVGIGS